MPQFPPLGFITVFFVIAAIIGTVVVVAILTRVSERNLRSRSVIHATSDAKSYDRICIDPQSKTMIDEYRQRFSAAPIGMWVDCLDHYMGLGFGGCTAHFSETTFKDDGTGRWACRDETVLFIWRSVGERVIEVQSVEFIPPLEGLSDAEFAEQQEWHRVEYDFVVPEYIRVPTICDVNRYIESRICDGTINPFTELQFMQCFGYRMGGTLQLRTSQSEIHWQESQWTRWLAENRANPTARTDTDVG